jgi:hypothetical protein
VKVLAGSRLDLDGDPPVDAEQLAAAMCRRLAGEGGTVVSLAALGLKNPYRTLSAAEVEMLRGALRDERGVVGYVCRGVAPPGGRGGWVAVTDHASLTWRSPLVGPNDERAGPRFPSLAGAYAPETILTLVGGQDGMIVATGMVAGVADDRAMSDYEADMVAHLGPVAVSSELVAPVIVAAHMGLQVAAVVMTV